MPWLVKKPVKLKIADHAPECACILCVPDHPPAEEDLGGGDFCSLEPCPPTEDDRPLD